MPAKATCQPWCAKHEEEVDDCCTRLITIFIKDEDESAAEPQNPELAALRDQFQKAGGFPDQIDTVQLDISQPGDAEQPELLLRFWDSTKDDDSAMIVVDLEDLRDFRAGLGEAIKVLEQGA